jgi:hypothetical protein
VWPSIAVRAELRRSPLYVKALEVVVIRLSTRIIIGCVLVLSAAEVAAAQTMTANGTTGASSINRGDTVTITTSGSATNWVGLFPAGAGNSNFLQYVYLNGAVLITFQTGSLLPGAYEFRELTALGSRAFE